MLNKERLNNLSNEVWNAAIKLRGKFKANDYPSVILPLIMIRRIECVLEEKRADFRNELLEQTPDLEREVLETRVKNKEQRTTFYNETQWTLSKILDESATQVEANFRDYLNGFSPNLQEIIERFDYRSTVTKVVKAKSLAKILQFASDAPFSLSDLSNLEMGYVYEDLLQRFSQDDAKGTGEHFTPREVIRIMVDMMEIDFDPETATKAISIHDPACGTGGMLSIAKEHLVDLAQTKQGQKNVEDLVLLNGQELLPQNYAVCLTDMILKGEKHINITCGNSLIPNIKSIEDDGDQHQNQHFDYLISNPPFGVTWSGYEDEVAKLSTSRYSWGMPAKGDGSLLFLQTLLEKMKPASQGGSRASILFNGSPLSNGDATSGESEIRRHLLENDLLDTIIMLPDQMFYNTGIYTYIWVLNNNKPTHKRGKVLLINAREQFEKEPKSFGHKRNRITDDHRHWINQQFQTWENNDQCQVFNTTDFAYHKIKLTYWQEDEYGEQMWITKDLGNSLTTAQAKSLWEKYEDITYTLEFTPTDYDAFTLEFLFNQEQGFETVLKSLLKKRDGLAELSAKDLATWLKLQMKEAKVKITCHHRHYIDDTEYIPFDATATDKDAHIEAFLDREIDYKVICWEEFGQLGYEILPNKYFYQYTAPEPSDQLLQTFYSLEQEANDLLNSIKAL